MSSLSFPQLEHFIVLALLKVRNTNYGESKVKHSHNPVGSRHIVQLTGKLRREYCLSTGFETGNRETTSPKTNTQAGEVAQWLGVLTALTQDPHAVAQNKMYFLRFTLFG